MELHSNTPSLFSLEASSWNATNLISTNMITTCSGYELLGGYKVLGTSGTFQKDYGSLPSHNIIYFQIRFFLLDNWQLLDQLYLQFDDTSVSAGNIYQTKILFSSLCGNPLYKDMALFTVVGKVVHKTSSLNLQVYMKTLQASSLISFGFRSLSLTFATVSTPQAQSCFRISESYSYGFIGECSCPRGTFQDPSNFYQCSSCDPSCLDCFGSSSSQCYAANDGYSFIGTQTVQCDSSCDSCNGTGSGQCVTCKDGYWLYPDNTCRPNCNAPSEYQQVVDSFKVCQLICNSSQYYTWNSTCLSICPAPLIAANDGSYLTCNKPCQDDSDFLYPNGTCLSTCSFPYQQSEQEDVNLCSPPCQDSQYYHLNGSCISKCDFPFKQAEQANISICISSCLNNDFLYWNDSCLSVCNSPLLKAVQDNNSLCVKPCQDSQFLDWDNTCRSKCDSPLIPGQQESVKFCTRPCQGSRFYYWNSSCIDSCPTPYTNSISDKVKYCNKPCPKNLDYYYPGDNLCMPACNSPNIKKTVNTINFCLTGPQNNQLTLSEADIKNVQQTTTVVNTVELFASIGFTTSSIASSSNPAALFLISLGKMLQYIRYMNIKYPPKLTLLLLNQNTISINFGPDLPQSVVKKFPDYPLPTVFERYGLPSDFIVNFWEAISTLLIIAIIIVISSIIAKHTYLNVKFRVIHILSKRIKNITKWDFFLLVFCSNFDGIAFFSALQLQTVHFNSPIAVISSASCLLLNIFAIYLLIKLMHIIITTRSTKAKVACVNKAFQAFSKAAPKVKDGYTFGLLIKKFKDKYLLQQSCMFFFLLRVYFFNAIIGYLYEFPLVQSSLILSLNVLMLIYLAAMRPFKETFDFIQLFVNELIIAVVNINVLIMAILDHQNKEAPELRVSAGNVIIISNIIFNSVAIVFLVSDIVQRLRRVRHYMKESKFQGRRVSVAKVLLTMLEKDGITLEERPYIEDLDRANPSKQLELRPPSNRVHIEPSVKQIIKQVAAISATLKDIDHEAGSYSPQKIPKSYFSFEKIITSEKYEVSSPSLISPEVPKTSELRPSLLGIKNLKKIMPKEGTVPTLQNIAFGGRKKLHLLRPPSIGGGDLNLLSPMSFTLNDDLNINSPFNTSLKDEGPTDTMGDNRTILNTQGTECNPTIALIKRLRLNTPDPTLLTEGSLIMPDVDNRPASVSLPRRNIMARNSNPTFDRKIFFKSRLMDASNDSDSSPGITKLITNKRPLGDHLRKGKNKLEK